VKNIQPELAPPPEILIDDVAFLQKEANHRVANSLQLVTALLVSQTRGLIDPGARAAIDGAIGRISAIATVHRHLCDGAGGGLVEAAGYMRALARGLEQGSGCGGAHRRIHVDVTEAFIPTKIASSLGIIVTELVLNACKHAYAADEAGDVWIRLLFDEAGYWLEVEDHGCGMGSRGETGSGTGSRIIEILVGQIEAQCLCLTGRQGTAFLISGALPRAR